MRRITVAAVGYVIVALLGVAACFTAWYAGRRRHRLTALRVVLVTLLAGGTGVAVWALYVARDAAQAGAAVGSAFGNAATGWH